MNQPPEAPLRFHAGRKQMLLLLLISIVFVALGAWLFPDDPVMASILIGFFALGIVVALLSLHPRGAYLEIDDDGFTVCSLFRKSFTAWKDVQDFYPVRIGSNTLVGWDYNPHFQAAATGRSVARTLTGTEGALPDTYGMLAETLAGLMNEKLEAWHLGDHGNRPPPGS